MLIALISDIHANLPALEAVLSAVRRHHPDRILSLGDQINLGPSPREVLSLLKENGVCCLHGNHERYVLSALDGDAAYAGANFGSVRWNAEKAAQRRDFLSRYAGAGRDNLLPRAPRGRPVPRL